MTAKEMAEALDLTVIVPGRGLDREVTGGYVCDLLSFVMGRAKSGDAWITVMGHVNAIAVAVLADVSCIILSEGVRLSEEAAQKARQNGVTVFSGRDTSFALAAGVSALLGG